MSNVDIYLKARRLEKQVMVEKASDRKADKKVREMKRALKIVMNKVKVDIIRMIRSERGYREPTMFEQALHIVLNRYRDEFTEIMAGYNVEAAQLGKNKTVSHMQVLGFGLQHRPVTDRVLEQLLVQTFEASETTLSNITGDVMDNLVESYRQGLGIDDTAKRLEEVFDNMEDYQLERIARTEINGNLQKGAHLTMEELGVEYVQWISASDDRTRDSHVDLDGQIVRAGDKFENGLEHPGDRSGPIEEWINCRCREVPFFIPEGYIAPAGLPWFYESQLERIY